MPRHQAKKPCAVLVVAAGFALSSLACPVAADPLDPLPVIGVNDASSFLLFMSDELGNEHVLNGNAGPASIQRGTIGSPVNAGASLNTPAANILVGWDEIFDSRPGFAGTYSRTRFEIKTSDASPFISQAAADNGFNYMRWELGAHNSPADAPLADAVEFGEFVSDVVFVEARAVFFNGNIQLNSMAFGFTLGIGSTWNGTDALPGNLFTVGSDVNRIEITYDYDPEFVPAPTTAGLLLGAGLLGTRRRRSPRL